MSEFKGKFMVNIREYYEKVRCGCCAPRCACWALLEAHTLPGGNTPARAGSADCVPWHCLACRPRTRPPAACPVQDGEMLPGKKGISLPEEQWTRLLAGLPGLVAALEAA